MNWPDGWKYTTITFCEMFPYSLKLSLTTLTVAGPGVNSVTDPNLIRSVQAYEYPGDV
jgi:hypothetical protein